MQHVILQEVEAATLCYTELGGRGPSLPEAEPWAGGAAAQAGSSGLLLPFSISL